MVYSPLKLDSWLQHAWGSNLIKASALGVGELSDETEMAVMETYSAFPPDLPSVQPLSS